MKLYLQRNKAGVNATAEYDETSGKLTVLKGSKVSERIAYTEKFRGAKSIEAARSGLIENGVLLEDKVFKSALTAANFVTGSSTNGLIAWKDTNGNTLKAIKASRKE